MNADQLALFKLIPENGSTIGNKNLREQIKWEEEKYWRIRDELIHLGNIRKATGKGGAVARVNIDSSKEEQPKKQEKKEKYKNEKSLYKPFQETII